MKRRSFLQLSAGALASGLLPRHAFAGFGELATEALPLPTPAQLTWQRDEFALFMHFGINTFTNREWGDGREDPHLFAPANLDTRQWARVARQAGAKAMILTAKHHDGFCLWPSNATRHSVASTPWRSGTADIVREFVGSCRAEGLRPGLYLSPWDRNNPLYGDSDRYNDLYCEQLTELLTRYGPISEVWFDGANGEGPNGKKQVYDWPRVFALVRKLQPDAVMFSDAGPDVRWCGNERGAAGDPNWSMVDPAAVPFPGASGPGVTEALQHGSETGTVWRPAEVDVSIRPGWFSHPREDDRVRSADELLNLYFTSVGRNGKLLLNVPPTSGGQLHDVDVSHLLKFREKLNAMFAVDVAAEALRGWKVVGPKRAEMELQLPVATTVSMARLEEDITQGQRVSSYLLAGETAGVWRNLARGTTIGHAKIDRFTATNITRFKLVVDTIAAPKPVTVRLF